MQVQVAGKSVRAVAYPLELESRSVDEGHQIQCSVEIGISAVYIFQAHSWVRINSIQRQIQGPTWVIALFNFIFAF